MLNKAASAPERRKKAAALELRKRHIKLNVFARGKKRRKINLKGVETLALFDVWPAVATHLGLAGSTGDAAMQHMGHLIRVLYRTSYPADKNPAPWVFGKKN